MSSSGAKGLKAAGLAHIIGVILCFGYQLEEGGVTVVSGEKGLNVY